MAKTETPQKILRTNTIQNVFDMFPQKSQALAEVMTRNGLHCVGCHASVFETLEQGILGHGFPEEKLNEMLKELNDTVANESDETTISLTENAADKIKKLLVEEKKENWGLRFNLNPQGQDFEYELTFRENAGPGERTLEGKGIPIFVPSHDWPKLANTVIDFVDNPEGAGFKINNPNES